jgi:hypothetical protein
MPPALSARALALAYHNDSPLRSAWPGTLCGIISRRALVSLVNKTTKPTAAELVQAYGNPLEHSPATQLQLTQRPRTTAHAHSGFANAQKVGSADAHQLPRVEWKVDLTPRTRSAFLLFSLPHGPACVMHSLPLPSSRHPRSADINRWPYTLGPTATLTRAFQLFRLMGLRHLIISTRRRRRRAQAHCFG